MTEAASPILSAVDVTYGFPGREDFLHPIRLELRPGDCCGIIGPNGAGKSTLLRLLAGLLSPRSGRVLLDGCDLASVPARARARRVAFLPQHLPTNLNDVAREIVLMGRFPHRRFGIFEDASDAAIAAEALALTQADAFAERSMCTLSGGEAQRVHLAAAIAQQPAVLLLDEPTAALDLSHQLGIFSILRTLAEREHLAVAIVTHDVNLAARFCTQVLLLNEGRPIAAGPPQDVITPEVLGPVYGVELAVASAEHAAGRWVVPVAPDGVEGRA